MQVLPNPYPILAQTPIHTSTKPLPSPCPNLYPNPYETLTQPLPNLCPNPCLNPYLTLGQPLNNNCSNPYPNPYPILSKPHSILIQALTQTFGQLLPNPSSLLAWIYPCLPSNPCQLSNPCLNYYPNPFPTISQTLT